MFSNHRESYTVVVDPLNTWTSVKLEKMCSREHLQLFYSETAITIEVKKKNKKIQKMIKLDG